MDSTSSTNSGVARSEDGFHPVIEVSIPLRWGDMDAFGHVNNTVYFRFMEEVRIAWFRQLAVKGGHTEGQGPVIVNASMEFLRQLHYPGDVLGRMSVGTPGRSSFETRFELVRADDPATLYARGAAKCVWVDYAASKSVAIPDALRTAIETAQPVSIAQ
jgi:acyl-CoA thioester hydrolase